MTRNDEKKNRHLADWILILLVIALLVSLGIYVMRRKNRSGEVVEVRCLMRVSGVENSLLELHNNELIKPGMPVMNANGTVVLGTVETVMVRPHEGSVLRDGVPAWEAINGKSDLEITVKMEGVRREGDGIRVKDIRMAACGIGSFRFGGYYADRAGILSVEVIGT